MKREQIRIFHGCVQRQGQILLDHWDLSAYAGEVLGVVSLDNNELDAVFQVLTGQRSLDRGDFFYLGEIAAFRSTSDAMACGIYGIQRMAAIVRRENAAANICTIPGGGWLKHLRKHTKSRIAAVPLVRYPGILVRRRRAEVIVREFFAKWNLPIEAKASAERLSRGEQLCVEIARAVLAGARVIVMNRIGNSCRMAPELLPNLFQRLKELGITIIFEDNQLSPLLELSDRVMVIRDGMTEGVFEKGELNLAELTFLLADRSLSERYIRRTHRTGAAALQLSLRAETQGKETDDIILHQGEIVGIRDFTELRSQEVLRILSGTQRPGDGEIRLAETGKKVNFRRLAEAFGCHAEDYSKYPDQISAIQQFRLCLVRAEMMHAKILILISPSRHLDFVSRRQMCEWIDRCAESGTAVLILSSNTSVLEDLCDRMYPEASNPKKIPQI